MNNTVSKDLALKVLKKGHQDLQNAIINLSPVKLESQKVADDWTIKDMIAHISAWYWEFIREIDSFLANQPIINFPSGDDTFNAREVAKRKNQPTCEIVNEWEQAFTSLILRVEKLSDQDWSRDDIQSLFTSYQDSSLSHEGEHAIQVKKILQVSS